MSKVRQNAKLHCRTQSMYAPMLCMDCDKAIHAGDMYRCGNAGYSWCLECWDNYVCGLMEQIAGELNIKEIRLKIADKTFVYYYDTTKNKTISFDAWIIAALKMFSGDIIKDMQVVRDVVKEGFKKRKDAGIKIRQPLKSVTLQL